jgi:hypothetical protein
VDTLAVMRFRVTIWAFGPILARMSAYFLSSVQMRIRSSSLNRVQNGDERIPSVVKCGASFGGVSGCALADEYGISRLPTIRHWRPDSVVPGAATSGQDHMICHAALAYSVIPFLHENSTPPARPGG